MPKIDKDKVIELYKKYKNEFHLQNPLLLVTRIVCPIDANYQEWEAVYNAVLDILKEEHLI